MYYGVCGGSNRYVLEYDKILLDPLEYKDNPFKFVVLIL
jgi:hypothetical protein